jgi:hypothetical protein
MPEKMALSSSGFKLKGSAEIYTRTKQKSMPYNTQAFTIIFVSKSLPGTLRKHPVGDICTDFCCPMSCQYFLKNKEARIKS